MELQKAAPKLFLNIYNPKKVQKIIAACSAIQGYTLTQSNMQLRHLPSHNIVHLKV
jgi:hypothetical protein